VDYKNTGTIASGNRKAPSIKLYQKNFSSRVVEDWSELGAEAVFVGTN